MDIQRLRNLTTGYLHTEIGHIYEDIEYLTGAGGIMTHMIPNACKAMRPWLESKIADNRFFDHQHDPAHVGEFDIAPMSNEERAEMFDRYTRLPSPLAGKKVIPVVVN